MSTLKPFCVVHDLFGNQRQIFKFPSFVQSISLNVDMKMIRPSTCLGFFVDHPKSFGSLEGSQTLSWANIPLELNQFSINSKNSLQALDWSSLGVDLSISHSLLYVHTSFPYATLNPSRRVLVLSPT